MPAQQMPWLEYKNIRLVGGPCDGATHRINHLPPDLMIVPFAVDKGELVEARYKIEVDGDGVGLVGVYQPSAREEMEAVGSDASL